MPKLTRKPEDLQTNPITIHWPDKSKTSIRGPLGLKEQLHAVLALIEKETGTTMTTTDYVLLAIRYYGYYLLEAKDIEELQARLETKHEILDVKHDEDSLEEQPKGPE